LAVAAATSATRRSARALPSISFVIGIVLSVGGVIVAGVWSLVWFATC
jgi:hypothetical protein